MPFSIKSSGTELEMGLVPEHTYYNYIRVCP